MRLSPEDAGNADHKKALDSAVSRWFVALDGLPSVPSVSSSFTFGNADWIIDFQFTGTPLEYCGRNPAGTTTTIIHSSGHPDCIGAPPGSLVNVLVHELVHTLGFSNALEGKGQAGYSDHCALYLNPDGAVNGGICQHEIELLLSKYGERDPIPSESFWSHHIITGVQTSPPTVTVAEGSDAALAATHLGAERSRRTLRAVDDETFSWVSANEAIARVTPAGASVTVNGQAVGTTILAARTSSGLNADEEYGSQFALHGTSVPVTVTASSGGGGGGGGGAFRVDTVLGPARPIVTSGSYGFSAVLENESSAGILSHDWTFDFSKPGIATILSSAEAPVVNVPAGSYTIEVHVEVMDATGTRASRIEHWPVCTESGGGGGGGGGGEQLRRGLDDPDGGVTPQAVEGC